MATTGTYFIYLTESETINNKYKYNYNAVYAKLQVTAFQVKNFINGMFL